jgi:coenzyme F420-reducing hydrogenase alpha subunit
MAGVSLDIRNSEDSETPREDDLVVTDSSGKESRRFSVEKALDYIDLANENWSYLPFAFFRNKGWQGIKLGADSLFFTGPLARMNHKKAMDTERAEEERCNMVENLGSFPHFSVCAAFWALIVEAFQSAEKMTRLCVREKLTGPFTRQIPKNIGSEGFAALESPQGIIYHHYQVDSKGLVKNIRILDTSMQNNALRCLIAQKAYEVSMTGKDSWEKTKNRIEVSLLPF